MHKSLPTPKEILKKYWKHDSFRPLQEEIIRSVLSGNDTLALLPTGGGKSICFQVPGIMLDGLCLVISPLIALMRDQVDALNNKGIPAAALHSGLSYYEVKKLLLDAADGAFKFLYCSPERLESRLFMDYMPVLPVSLLVIDEAHCISQWGYDFRPPYLRIAATRKQLPDIPLIALTASATPLVQEDIVQKLELKKTAVFRQSFERPNLSYSNFQVASKLNKILDILNKVPGSSIVYCNNRKQTKKIAEALLLQGIAADYYHAGLAQPVREMKQQAWIQNKIRTMVCTNAFGMGIDKPDVRVVIHHDVTECLENYYQEAGRAGRDGKKAYAVLLYQQKDLNDLVANTAKKFPSIKLIKQVYQAIADYLQIPVGNGEGIYYDFDLAAFTRHFKLESLLVINVLKVLEQEDHISFAENIFLPTQLSFTVDREGLNLFEKEYPDLEPVIKSLLRTYEGIIDNRVSVYEQQVGKICRRKADEITTAFKELAKHGIVEYLPKKETPQIQFLLNRAPAEYLVIHQDAYLQRKKLYEERINTILQYTKELTGCRSRFISNYFGDQSTKTCGICDNCLNAKKKPLTPEELTRLEEELKKIATKPLALEELLLSFKQLSEEKIWAALDFLQSEEKIRISETRQIWWIG
ncbi:MAG: RecQ family ATP-dependent DNA helicase [Sphingobacteriia bacterium]|nr:RecQ family ATP-dependent DNA helicase [Sphingobacteriia bacterium]